MLIRLSGRPPGAPDPDKRDPSGVIERFFALLERLAPAGPAPETKSRRGRTRRAKPRASTGRSAGKESP
jgi:hypothetical protein